MNPPSLLTMRNMAGISEWNNYAITMNEIFDENGNYIYPTDVVLDEPNTVIGYISTSDKDDGTITQ